MFSCAHIRINFFPLIFTAYKRFWRFFPAVHFSTCINSDSSKIYRFSCLRRELTIERERRYFPWHFGNVCLYGLIAVLVDLSVNTFEESSMECKIKRHIFLPKWNIRSLSTFITLSVIIWSYLVTALISAIADICTENHWGDVLRYKDSINSTYDSLQCS